MGSEIHIFSLYKKDNRFLLVRVEREGFSNVDEDDYDRVCEGAEMPRDALVGEGAIFVGEFQGLPQGDEFYGERGLIENVWYAKHERDWFIVLGQAQSEEDFWQEVEIDEYRRPATFIGEIEMIC